MNKLAFTLPSEGSRSTGSTCKVSELQGKVRPLVLGGTKDEKVTETLFPRLLVYFGVFNALK